VGFLIMDNFYVYIIYSATIDKFYIGYTTDLQKRHEAHNSGISTFTSKAKDWKLKYSEKYETRELAMKREREIKSKKSRKYIEWLIGSVG
jgi:putative endonuclease